MSPCQDVRINHGPPLLHIIFSSPSFVVVDIPLVALLLLSTFISLARPSSKHQAIIGQRRQQNQHSPQSLLSSSFNILSRLCVLHRHSKRQQQVLEPILWLTRRSHLSRSRGSSVRNILAHHNHLKSILHPTMLNG